jgi:hypothetical protein
MTKWLFAEVSKSKQKPFFVILSLAQHLSFLSRRDSYTNDYFLTDTTKDEKWLVLVGRPSLAASRWRARRPAPPSYFHIKLPSNK